MLKKCIALRNVENVVEVVTVQEQVAPPAKLMAKYG
jgi:hypothetical protein